MRTKTQSRATLKDAVQKSAEELQARVEEHRRLLRLLLQEGGDVETIQARWFYLECPHKRRLRQVVLEAVRVIEETRKAFKSRQLEALRRRLTEVLAEENVRSERSPTVPPFKRESEDVGGYQPELFGSLPASFLFLSKVLSKVT